MCVAALCFFCLFAGFGGFAAGKLHRVLAPQPAGGGVASAATPGAHGGWAGGWRRSSAGWVPPGLLVALGFPGLAFTAFGAANMALHANGSSAAVPLPAALALAFLWLAVAAPLAFAGAACGHRQPPLELPIPVDPFPRQCAVLLAVHFFFFRLISSHPLVASCLIIFRVYLADSRRLVAS